MAKIRAENTILNLQIVQIYFRVGKQKKTQLITNDNMYSFKSNNEPNLLMPNSSRVHVATFQSFKGKKFKFQYRFWQKKNTFTCMVYVKVYNTW